MFREVIILGQMAPFEWVINLRFSEPLKGPATAWGAGREEDSAHRTLPPKEAAGDLSRLGAEGPGFPPLPPLHPHGSLARAHLTLLYARGPSREL